MIKAGQLVPGNMYFTTTKLHQELAGGVFEASLLMRPTSAPASDYSLKENIDM